MRTNVLAFIGATALLARQCLAQSVHTPQASSASLSIAAVASKGSDGVCNDEDWIQLKYEGSGSLDLSGYTLEDSKGDDGKFTFPNGSLIGSNAVKTMCKDSTDSFTFGIGTDDTVTLKDDSGNLLENITLPATGSGNNQVYTFDDVTDTWKYVNYASTPPPPTAAPTAAPSTPPPSTCPKCTIDTLAKKGPFAAYIVVSLLSGVALGGFIGMGCSKQASANSISSLLLL